ncbi:CBS domain-containing protein [Pendulispora brunnea]|uniref:CBS domain-containing protein n=1 Tax=Pendulispora brunnea TaxID=2905690 RepID=A0ABZ2JZ40_9BACT
MSATVRDFMNPKLVYLREGDPAELALHPILNFGITAVPVVDEDYRPVGIVSLRDLADPQRRGHRVSQPVETISADAPISLAAVALSDADVHHLVVVDDKKRAVGMISTLDVIRAMLGIRAKHPRSITMFDGSEPQRTYARDAGADQTSPR